jgi:hypothetical protein
VSPLSLVNSVEIPANDRSSKRAGGLVSPLNLVKGKTVPASDRPMGVQEVRTPFDLVLNPKHVPAIDCPSKRAGGSAISKPCQQYPNPQKTVVRCVGGLKFHSALSSKNQ